MFKSWAVTKGPSLDPKDKRLAVETEDHPLDYGDFEGTIPEGEYGGGTVMLWDRGFWAPEGDPAKALRKGDLRFALAGDKLQGSWVLVRLRHDRERGKRTNQLLIKRHDGHERENDKDKVLSRDRSVASKRSIDEIAAGRQCTFDQLPRRLGSMLRLGQPDEQEVTAAGVMDRHHRRLSLPFLRTIEDGRAVSALAAGLFPPLQASRPGRLASRGPWETAERVVRAAARSTLTSLKLYGRAWVCPEDSHVALRR